MKKTKQQLYQIEIIDLRVKVVSLSTPPHTGIVNYIVEKTDPRTGTPLKTTPQWGLIPASYTYNVSIDGNSNITIVCQHCDHTFSFPHKISNHFTVGKPYVTHEAKSLEASLFINNTRNVDRVRWENFIDREITLWENYYVTETREELIPPWRKCPKCGRIQYWMLPEKGKRIVFVSIPIFTVIGIIFAHIRPELFGIGTGTVATKCLPIRLIEWVVLTIEGGIVGAIIGTVIGVILALIFIGIIRVSYALPYNQNGTNF